MRRIALRLLLVGAVVGLVIVTALTVRRMVRRAHGVKDLKYDVFYIGMPADEALAKLPPDCSLNGSGELHTPELDSLYPEYKDVYSVIGRGDPLHPETYEFLGLSFDEEKRLSRVGLGFDEEKYVALYRQRLQNEARPVGK